MARFVLQQPKSSATAADGGVPAALRRDERVTIIDEMPRLLLIDCSEEVAEEWLERMPGWTMQREHRAKVPDPRPKLR
jgi:hypothetical protein